MTLNGPWILRVPFTSAPELRFTEELVNTVAGYTISIRPGGASYSHIVVEELDTIDQVRGQFEALKRGMLTASLNVGCGIRIKDDLRVIDDDGAALPSEADQPFVCRQARNHRRLIITAGEPMFQLPLVLPDVMQGLEVGIASRSAMEALRDEFVTLACELYTDSFFERSFEARFITLIGVLEVLKDQAPVSSEAVRLIDDWRSGLKQSKIVEADSLRGQLDRMKQLSVGSGIGSVVARHLGQDRARVVKDLYEIRSKLVHHGKRPPDLQDCLRQAQLIVQELLIKVLLSGSR